MHDVGHAAVAELTVISTSAPPSIALYCPPGAASEFGYRPDVAAHYVCAWDSLPAEAAGE